MSGKCQKEGRNKPYCTAYFNAGKRDKARTMRILAHIKRYGQGDGTAIHAYNNLPMIHKPASARSLAVIAAPCRSIKEPKPYKRARTLALSMAYGAQSNHDNDVQFNAGPIATLEAYREQRNILIALLPNTLYPKARQAEILAAYESRQPQRENAA